MISAVQKYAAAAVLLALLGYGGHHWYQGRRVAMHVKAADKLEVQQAAAGTQAETHEQAAQALTPTIQSDDVAVAQASEVVARLRHPSPVSPAKPDQSTADPQPIPPPVDVAALDAAKDDLIAALTKANADKDAAIAAWKAGDESRQAQVKALQGEVVQLRTALAIKKDLHWGIAAIRGTSQTVGAGVEYDWGVVRVGTDLVRHQIAGGQTSLEAVGRLVIRF